VRVTTPSVPRKKPTGRDLAEAIRARRAREAAEAKTEPKSRRVKPTITASSVVETLYEAGASLERIEDEVVRQRNELKFDLPLPHPFYLEGVRSEHERVRNLVCAYVRLLSAQKPVGVQPFEEEAFSFGEDNSWFSPTPENVSQRWWVRSRTFDQLWVLVKNMAYGIAHKMVRAYNLDGGWIETLVREAQEVTWKCQRTFKGGAKFTTYVHRAMQFAMLDAVGEELGRRERPGSQGTPDATTGRYPFEATDDWLDTLALLRDDADGVDLLKYALGFKDKEIGTNARVRRSRARTRLRHQREVARA
jgi:DNA-directed RNA polymerase specialized sigma24 family protein